MAYVDPNDTYNRRGSKHNISRRDYLCDSLKYAKRGNDLPQSKLCADKVRKIRIEIESGATSKSLAAEYGVHIRTIDKIRSYKTWVHV
jgi:hypothetical protein